MRNLLRHSSPCDTVSLLLTILHFSIYILSLIPFHRSLRGLSYLIPPWFPSFQCTRTFSVDSSSNSFLSNLSKFTGIMFLHSYCIPKTSSFTDTILLHSYRTLRFPRFTGIIIFYSYRNSRFHQFKSTISVDSFFNSLSLHITGIII